MVPSWVGHTRIAPSAPGDEDATLVLGLGARLRLTKTMALVGEVNPRLAGYAGDLGSGDSDRAGLVRRGVARGRPRLPDQLLERPRHDPGAGGARTAGQRRTGTSASTSPASSIDGGRCRNRSRKTGRARDGRRPPPVHAGLGHGHPERRGDHDPRPAEGAALAVHAHADADPGPDSDRGRWRQDRRHQREPRALRRDHRRRSSTAGGALNLDIRGQRPHPHRRPSALPRSTSIAGNQRVSKESTTDSAHSHTVTFN